MKLIIAGSRDASLQQVLSAIKDCSESGTFNPYDASEVVCGEARGADRCGKIWAIQNKVVVVSFPPDWDSFGKAAGHVRNAQMANYGTHLLAVWDGKSKGTENMINQAKKKGLVTYVWRY